jgi:hypothetical protein
LWCDLNAISLPAIRSSSKFSKFLWEQFRFFFEVKVSSEIPQWNKYAMRSYASRKMYVMYPTPAANEFQFCWVCGVLLHQRSFHEAPEQIGFECLSILPTYLLDMNVQCGLWFQFIAQQ